MTQLNLRMLLVAGLRVGALYGMFLFAASAQEKPGSAASAGPREEAPPIHRVADSPRAMLALYFDAARQGRWDDASRYLVLNDAERPNGARLARRLKGVIDDHAWLDLDTVSADPRGRLDDGLPSHLEDVERVRFGGREESIRLIRINEPMGARWAVAASTVQRIDDWYAELPDRWVRNAIVYAGLDSVLLRPGPLELLWWQWSAMPLLGIASLLLGSVLGKQTQRLFVRLAGRTALVWDRKVLGRIGTPLLLAWSLNLFWLGAQFLVLTDPAYRSIDSFVTAGMVFVIFWALWQASGAIAEQMLLRPWATRSASARTLVTVGGNFARSAIFCLGGLAVLAAAGYPVGTLLAGLGIGGLAIAFGAQKTIENIFGSLSLVVDQPLRVGDFVHLDDVVGTVEDIGLRSTRIRTLDRTLVTIPNGKLADQRIESYEARDRMRLSTTLSIEYGATRAQIESVIAGVERVLNAHPQIWPDAVTVKLSRLGPSSLDIDVMAWFQVQNSDVFQRCRQEALLGFMRVVEEAGTQLAFPTQTVHLVAGGARTQVPPLTVQPS